MNRVAGYSLDYYTIYFITIQSAAVVPAPWKGGSNLTGDWGDSANWGGAYNNVCVPDGAGSKITLDNQTTTVKSVDMATVGRTVGSITFTGDNTLISSSGGFSLTMDNIDTAAVIDVTGNHAISAPVVLGGDLKIVGQGTLNMTGGVSGDHALQVADGTLNAASIRVDSLIIGNPPIVVPPAIMARRRQYRSDRLERGGELESADRRARRARAAKSSLAIRRPTTPSSI